MSKQKQALVVGGTGPTGPHVVNGLLARDYKVTIFHRGTHESDEIPDEVEHIHGDPHFAETIAQSLGNREFDLVIAMYGRTRLLAGHLKGRVERFISVGSVAATRGHFAPEALAPQGLPLPASETEPTVGGPDEPDGHFAWRIAETERTVMTDHPNGTILRYPIIYGPNQVLPFEWALIRRALDRRPFVIVPDAGLRIVMRGYSVNMAHAVMCAVDNPSAASGQIFNCGDERQLTLHEVAEIVGSTLGHSWEIIGVPARIAKPAWPMIYTDPQGSWHRMYSIEKLKGTLGYRDVLQSPQAMSRTVEWFADRAATLGPDIEKRLKDPFDYAAEDQLAADWGKAINALLQRYGSEHSQTAHPYAHPRKPGEKQDHLGR